jgi:murein DD-endopeptidase MepM/ murein hydrolase activator NlpD
MMKDERIYAYIIARTSRSRARIRQVSIHRRWVKVGGYLSAVVLCAALYGVYGLVRQVAHARIEHENSRLRKENERQKQKLDQLKNRIDAIETDARRLSEISGATEQQEGASAHGAGGPLVVADEAAIAAIEARTAQVEQQLRAYAQFVEREREQARMPSIWPVMGELTDYFGARRNPFGGGSTEFHDGLDIATSSGTPVVATGNGIVSFAGTQSGYGQIVVVDHGNGLSTAYAHLSRVEAEVGRVVSRGDQIGRVGSTGRSTGPHLHYEVRVGETAVSPAGYLPVQQ